MKSIPFRLLLILALVAGCAWAVSAKPVRLGKDLRGGVSLVYGVSIPDGAPAEIKAQHDAVVHGKHAKKKRLAGRAKVQVPGKGAIASRRRFQKRTQSGK